MTCTFFGHREFPREMLSVLQTQIADLIERRGADRFYVGNQGGFDRILTHCNSREFEENTVKNVSFT